MGEEACRAAAAIDGRLRADPTARTFSAACEKFRWQLPTSLPAVNERGEIGGTITIDSYRQLFDFIDRNKGLALYHFQILHGEIAPGRIEGEYDPMA